MTTAHPDEQIATQPTPDQQTAYESARCEGQVGRFNRGLEAAPDTPRKLHRGRYSEGMERLPESPRKRHPGRFSDGVERTAESETKLNRGTFADCA